MTKKIKSWSVWVYFPFKVRDELEPRLENQAKSMGGEWEGSGTEIGTGCRDNSFAFPNFDKAHAFAETVRCWKDVNRVEEIEGE